MRVSVVLRTCDKTNVHTDWRVRYCNKAKDEVIQKCVKSLINTIKAVNGHDVELVILDDHSSESTIAWLVDQVSQLSNAELINLPEVGYNYSAHQQFLLCRDTNADLVYSVEDDYLHCPTALQEMLDSYQIFNERLSGRETVIYPFDEPTEYYPPNEKSYVVHGSARHWRTGSYTTNVMLARPQLFKDHWLLFETLALKYNGDYLKPRSEHYEESNTIKNIWTHGYAIRFSPIPSLALHMQFDPQKDPYIDWQYWWDNYTQ